MSTINVYSYSGPVEEFGRCVTRQWSAQTRATSEKEARSNLSYQYKKQFKKAVNVRVNLPGKITIVG